MVTIGELTLVRDLKARIVLAEKRLNSFRMVASNLVPIRDDMPKGSSVKSRVEEAALRIIQAESELKCLQEEFVQAKEHLVNRILDEIDDPTLQTLLLLRFVQLKTWTQVSRQMNFDRRWIYRLYQSFIKKATTSHTRSQSVPLTPNRVSW